MSKSTRESRGFHREKNIKIQKKKNTATSRSRYEQNPKKEENNKTIYSMFLMISECAISGEVERDCKQIPNVHRRHVVYRGK